MNKTILVSGVIIAAIITAFALLMPRSAENNEPQRVYIDKELPIFGNAFEGYVKAEDLKPNSSLYFVYPRTGDKRLDSEPFKIFSLVRLPSWKGGDANDASAFRSYSVMDLTILGTTGCMVRYWPEDGKQRFEDPCSGSMYRVEDGLAIAGPASAQKPPENVLPKLDIGIDEEGYLYVKPPKFDPNHNGVVRYGRYISEQEISDTNQKLIQDANRWFGGNLQSPSYLPKGVTLVNVSVHKDLGNYECAEKPKHGCPVLSEYVNLAYRDKRIFQNPNLGISIVRSNDTRFTPEERADNQLQYPAKEAKRTSINGHPAVILEHNLGDSPGREISVHVWFDDINIEVRGYNYPEDELVKVAESMTPNLQAIGRRPSPVSITFQEEQFTSVDVLPRLFMDKGSNALIVADVATSGTNELPVEFFVTYGQPRKTPILPPGVAITLERNELVLKDGIKENLPIRQHRHCSL